MVSGLPSDECAGRSTPPARRRPAPSPTAPPGRRRAAAGIVPAGSDEHLMPRTSQLHSLPLSATITERLSFEKAIDVNGRGCAV